MNACTSRCGWCGACDDGIREGQEPREYLTCDTCHGDAFQPISLQGVGIFCSQTCADAGSEKHAQHLERQTA